MKTVGIIAEYNPFHNGHQFHIEQSKEISGADYAVVVMSGDFTQRGAPALVDKHVRTQMALECGADLVLELPLYYACSSAEYFAWGAVNMLNKLGAVDSICFGSECGDIHTLQEIAAALSSETPAFSAYIKESLKEGFTFPQARALAFRDTVSDLPAYRKVLSSPNNILGIEYCKALLACAAPIVPYTISRTGSSYHAHHLEERNSSALAIRRSLEKNANLPLIEKQVPDSVYAILQKYLQKNTFVFANDFSALLQYKLLLDASAGYTSFVDVSSDLSNRIQNNLRHFTDFESFCQLLKTKEITYTRISRCLIHILLDMKKDSFCTFTQNGSVFYARILGFRKEASPLLSSIKKNTSLPLIAKLADANHILSASNPALVMLDADIKASHIYASVSNHALTDLLANEFTRTPFIK